MFLVVDASVVVKWFVDESGSDAARALFGDEVLFVAPGHMLGEVGEVLVRHLRAGKITEQQFEIARVALPGSFVSVALDEILADALRLAVDLEITVYDALYVVTADRWSTKLVTADRKLVRSVEKSPHAARMIALGDPVTGARSV